MSDNLNFESKEEIENTIVDVQNKIDKLPEPGVLSILIPSVVIVLFTALAVFSIGGILSNDNLAGKDLTGQLLGLLFFLMPIAFSFKYATKRIQIKRSRTLLINIKARLESKLGNSD